MTAPTRTRNAVRRHHDKPRRQKPVPSREPRQPTQDQRLRRTAAEILSNTALAPHIPEVIRRNLASPRLRDIEAGLKGFERRFGSYQAMVRRVQREQDLAQALPLARKYAERMYSVLEARRPEMHPNLQAEAEEICNRFDEYWDDPNRLREEIERARGLLLRHRALQDLIAPDHLIACLRRLLGEMRQQERERATAVIEGVESHPSDPRILAGLITRGDAVLGAHIAPPRRRKKKSKQ